jgi:hypothetical protein
MHEVWAIICDLKEITEDEVYSTYLRLIQWLTLTPCSRFLLEKLIILSAGQEIPCLSWNP